MSQGPKLSLDALRVLSLFHASPERAFYGRELSRRADVSSATVVRLLLRLEDDGWLRSEFQRGPRQTHRPKRFYTLTPRGYELSRRALKRVAHLDTVKEKEPRLLEAPDFERPRRAGKVNEQPSLF